MTVAALALFAAVTANGAATEPTVEELKARVSSTGIGGRPHLCVQIAEMQLTETDKLYAGAEDEKAQATLTDVVAYSEMARDYAIQSHKYQKQTEIAVRRMARKLTEVMHSLSHDDQAPVQDAVKRLQRVRDDLLMAMFPKATQ
jgi:D-arabinose 1-dehydrogenase-like Zn-dependent alcohol dehydrogenase